MIVSVIKISQKMKNKILLGIAKKYYRMRKNTQKKDLESSFDEEYMEILKNQFLSYKFTSES